MSFYGLQGGDVGSVTFVGGLLLTAQLLQQKAALGDRLWSYMWVCKGVRASADVQLSIGSCGRVTAYGILQKQVVFRCLLPLYAATAVRG
jgi:hypothetical protein